MAFTNTVETVGDAALTRSIIDRSITELNCNITTSIRQQAFRACAALASVNFPNVTSVADGAFYNCTALAKAEFGSAVAFANNAFYGCSNLTALILRSTDALCTITGTPFASSAIASGTGYIYVPKALVDQYKASWTAYAAQIRAIEDYSHVIDPYTWDAVAKNISAGTYASVYKVGDLVPLDLGTEGQINMQIAAFDADDLADGSGKAPISWISKELLNVQHQMNPAVSGDATNGYTEGTGSVGGWEKCEMRTYMQNTIKSLISADVKAMIKPVTKYSMINDTTGTSVKDIATTDEIWIPGYREMLGGTSYETLGPAYTTLFNSNSARIKYKVGSSSANGWWLRSAQSGKPERFASVNASGAANSGIANYTYATALGFCT